MSFNGSGTFVINSAGQPVVTGTVISSTAFNALTADLATGLSTTMTKDGQTTATANIPMGTFKFTGLGVGSAATDSANISQVQSSFGSFLTVSGTDTITATVSPSLTAYAAGQMFAFVAANTNTGAVTINISSLGAKSITKNGTTALVSGDLTANYLFVVVYDGTQFQVVGVSATTFTNLTISGVLTLSGANTQLLSTGTGAWKMPVGTTGQRPASPASGMIRMNSTIGEPEWYDSVNAVWLPLRTGPNYSVNYLVVAGGGGGGFSYAGGGGAGGLLSSSTPLSTGVAYTITVGAGGAGATANTATGTNGSNSIIFGLATAIGGGGGGSNGGSFFNGAAGGSGGGGSGYNGSPVTSGGSATSGQGNIGGSGFNAPQAPAAGGGGAGAVGANGNASAGGAGGVGSSNSISGSAVTYAGGGGGGGGIGITGGAGGSGGGGAGGTQAVAGTAASANTGGGGGGGGGSANGAAGGSGIVIISYVGSQRGTGGTVTSSGGYTIHTFTSSGTYSA